MERMSDILRGRRWTGPPSRVEGGFSTERSYNGKKGCRLAADREWEDKVEPQRWVGA